MSSSRLPDTLSIRELARRMAQQGQLPAPPREAVQRTRAADAQPDGVAAKWTVMRCTDIDCYDRNPRIKTNPRYADIRASVEARRGLTEALSITYRPGASRPMCYFGGNTRLQIVQELWLETREPCYEWIHVVVHPWVAESDVIASHLAENDTRGDISYWEKARGVAALKSELERERQRSLSLRELVAHGQRAGLKLHNVTAGNLLFAVDRLAPIGPHLTHDAVSALRGRFGRIEQLADGLNLDPLERHQAFEQLIADAATDINAVRETADPPRITAEEVEQLLARMTFAFAALAHCSVQAAEQALLTLGNSHRQLSQAEIRQLLPGQDGQDASSAEAPEVHSGPAGSPPARLSRPLGAPLGAFAAAFQLSGCLQSDPERPLGFSVAPLPTDAADGGAERAAAHRLLTHLAQAIDGKDPEADAQIVKLLRHPRSWALTRSLLNAYHRSREAE